MTLVKFRNICIYLFVVCFFFFPRLQTIFIGVAFFLTFFTGDFKNFKTTVFTNKTGLAIALYFLVSFLSLLYTTDLDNGWRGLEIKFSMIAFPLFLPVIFFDKKKINWNKLVKLVVFTAFIFAVLSFLRAFYLYSVTHKVALLFSSNLSFRLFQEGPFVHPTYLSIYYIVLILIVGNSVLVSEEKLNSKASLLKLSVLLFFVVFVFFLSSKVGLILVVLSVVILIAQYAIQKKKIAQALGLLLGFVILAGIGVNNSKLKVRFEQAFQDVSMNYDKQEGKLRSTSARIWVWKSSVLLIEENPILGVGIGDFRGEIRSKYKEVGIEDKSILKLDSHQQYLQTTATTGIVGLFFLILIFVSLFYYSVKFKSVVLFGFTITYLIFGLTESMLETQAGIIFFTFLAVILVSNLQNKIPLENV